MALPLIGLVFLICVAIVLFVIGISRYNVNASLGLVVLASVVLIASSMFIMNEGVQLETVDSIVEAGATTSVLYQEVAYDINSWNWLRVLTDVMFWGGFVGIIFGFAYNYQQSKKSQVDEWAIE